MCILLFICIKYIWGYTGFDIIVPLIINDIVSNQFHYKLHYKITEDIYHKIKLTMQIFLSLDICMCHFDAIMRI